MRPDIGRAIASDCHGLVSEIMNSRTKALKVKETIAIEATKDKIFKIKNTIWNKIISNKDFENFNDKEYFRWMEIYKDAKNDLSNVNPVSIEQKMALVEVVNGRLISSTPQTKSISAEVQKLSALKLKKLQMHMDSFDLSSKLTRDDLENFAADLLIILKGPPISLLDYFTMNKTKRMSERLARIVQEDILLIGLKGMVERIPEKRSYTRLERGKYIINRFFQLKIWKYLVVPYDLPWIERVKIPDELLEKIILNGLDAHDQELIAHLKKQNMIDHYERFRKVYKPIAFSVGFYFYYEKFKDEKSGELNEDQEEEKQKFLNDFKNLSEAIMQANGEVVKTEDVLKQEQFERVLQAFKEKYKEDPTPEEYEEMKQKIFGN